MLENYSFSRRDFLKSSALAGLAAAGVGVLAQTQAHAAGSDQIRVGIIGAGGRGTKAALDCLNAAPNTVIVAIGDLFKDRVDSSLAKLRETFPDRVQVKDDQLFAGFDNYKGVLACEVDLIITAAPPGFRPIHFKAAVDAGKHVFMEKPVAVDPIGVRSVIDTAELAQGKGLSVVVGTQRRHDPPYIEVMRRIHDGDIGELVAGQCYWCQGGLWVKEKTPEMSEMEWQIRNWLYFDWLSGDHIVEQHVHNIDVMNWAFGGPPVKAFGIGGRQARTDAKFGNIYDHFAIEYEYANGARVQSYCSQIENSSNHRVAEYIVGTKGKAKAGEITGEKAYSYAWPGEPVSPYVQEHIDLIKGIMDGKPVNEAKRVAESCLTAILGRMCAYTGREISFEWMMKSSKLNLAPEKYEFGAHEYHPAPVPGQYTLV